MRLFTSAPAAGLCAVLLAGISQHAFCADTIAPAPSAANAVSPLQPIALPLYFEPNRGQFHERVHAAARGGNYAAALSPEGIAVHPRQRAATPVSLPTRKSDKSSQSEPEPAPARPAPVQLRWIDSNPRAQATYEQPLPGVSHYFLGSDAKAWRTDVPHYGRVRYRDVYPGIDVVYYGQNAQLEYDLEVQPGADPGKIAFEFTGAQSVTTDAAGNLHLKTTDGDLVQHAPLVYQQVGSVKRRVQTSLKSIGGHRYALNLAAYDTGRTLVIDPVLSYATYVGGTLAEGPSAMVVDAAGNAYLTGSTSSMNFGGVNPFSIGSTGNSSSVGFVAKLDPQGRNLVYLAYLADAAPAALAVDAAGNAYVSGVAGAGFPTTAAAYQATNTSSMALVSPS